MISSVSAMDITNSTDGGIKQGITDSNDGILYLSDGIYSGENNTNITLDKNMTIIGNSKENTIIDGQGVNKFFNIPTGTGYSLTLINLTLKNGFSVSNNGTISNNGGTISIENCVFNNNSGYSVILNGYVSGSQKSFLTVKNSNFNSNPATNVIYNRGPNATEKSIANINSSDFNNGGRIYSINGEIVANYNRFMNTAISASASQNTLNFNFNWWGSNNAPSVATNNRFVVNVIPNGKGSFNYTIVLNDSNIEYNSSLLPDFNGVYYYDGGSNTTFSAKNNQSLSTDPTQNNFFLVVDNYKSQKITNNMTVNPIKNSNVGENITVSGTLKDVNNQNVDNVIVTVVFSNGTSYNITVHDGIFSQSFTVTNAGNFDVSVTYNGNDIITTCNTSFKVKESTIGQDNSSKPQFNNGGSDFVGPNTNSTKWNATLTANGKLAIGSDGTIYLLDTNGALSAYAPNGILKWKTENIATGTNSYPAIGNNGTIYVASNGTLFAFNKNGVLVNRFDSDSLGIGQSTSPQIGFDGTVYVVFNTTLYAINPNFSLKWKYDFYRLDILNATGNVTSYSISIANNGVIIDSNDIIFVAVSENQGASNKYIFSIQAILPNGTKKFESVVGTSSSVPIQAIAEYMDVVYVEMKNTVLIISKENGTFKSASGGSLSANPIAVGPGGVVIIGGNPIAAIRPDGSEVWSGWVYGLQAVYCFGADGVFYAKIGGVLLSIPVDNVMNGDPSQFMTKWSLAVDATDVAIGPNGTLYVVGGNKLYALQDLSVDFNYDTNNKDVDFVSNISHPVESYLWDFGDGNTSDQANPTHTYAKYGNYTVKLVINTLSGEVGNFETVIEVNDNVNPIADADKDSGTYYKNIQVELYMNELGKIYYTLNGSTPTNESILYNGLITVSSNSILKFIAIDESGNPSEVYTRDYKIDKTPVNVTANNKGGTYYDNILLTLNTSRDCKIYYTLDGSIPISTSNEYTGPIVINKNLTLKFISVNEAGISSNVVTEKYILDKSTPIGKVNYNSGIYNKDLKIALSMNKKGIIYYKLNNNAYTQYKGSITISKSSTISYYVKDSSGRTSKTTTLKYTIDKTSPKITKITPKNGYTKVAAKKQQIIIKFSEKIKATTSKYLKYIKLVNNKNKKLSTKVTIKGNNLIIKTAKLSSKITYKLSITKNLFKDYAGNKYSKSINLKFKTR